MDQPVTPDNMQLDVEKVTREFVTLASTREESVHSDINKRVFGRVYGQHEIQVSTGQEVDLHRHVKNCKKNPGHAEFVPAHTLRLDNLPEGYRDIALLDYIASVADLTVRVEVKMTSPARPKFYPDTSEPYPFCEDSGGKITRYGSGEINVLYFIEGRGYDESGSRRNPLGGQFERDYKTCPCDNCRESHEKKKEDEATTKASSTWWEILLITAAHVVFDDVEAAHTSCRLFFDGKGSPEITLGNLKLRYVSVERDWCVLRHVTCDSRLGDGIYKMAARRFTLWNDACVKRLNEGNLNFIVSHPHGCPKQVSFGRWTNNYDAGGFNDDFVSTQLTYTTSTCPGTSGAPVHCVGFIGGHVHCGTLPNGLNYSGVGFHQKKNVLC